MIEIEFKRVCFDKRLATPAYGTSKSAALDLQAVLMEPVTIYPGEPPLLIGTGIAVNMMGGPDMAAMILPRSGLGHKKGLILGNSVGLIDQDYQGQLMVSAWNRSDTPVTIQPFERFAQLVVVPILRVSLKEVEEFAATERGEGGFGSTGG